MDLHSLRGCSTFLAAGSDRGGIEAMGGLLSSADEPKTGTTVDCNWLQFHSCSPSLSGFNLWDPMGIDGIAK